MAVRLHADGIGAACVTRGPSPRPIVEAAVFEPFNAATQAASLEKFGKELSATRYECSCLLAPTDYQMLSVDAPNVPAEELKTAIRWRLKDMLDYHVNDATIDVLDVPVDKSAPTRNHSMYAIAARNQVIEQRQALFADAKIPLDVIDIPEMAQRNIATFFEPEGRGVALLSFDSDGGLLTVSHAGELYLSRRIDIGLSQLQDADEQVRHASFERITLELQRSLDHFDRHYHFVTLAKLLLGPIAEGGSELRTHLASNLYLQVESLDLADVLDFSSVPQLRGAEAQQRFFLVLGAALRREEKAL